jgi:rhamnosyltransferase
VKSLSDNLAAGSAAVAEPGRTVASSIVLYNPDDEAVARVLRYAGFMDLLIVVDNTEGASLHPRFAGNPAICYKPSGSNLGVAAALNMAAGEALERKYSWLMTLDQDSDLSATAYAALVTSIRGIDDPRVGLVAPVQASKESDLKQSLAESDAREVPRVMTSGSLLRLQAYLKCGPFEDKLFIDHVDHEYCLRLRRNHFRVVQLTRVVLEHALGEVCEGRILGKDFAFITHRPFRSYYSVRNGFYVGVKYVGYRPQVLASFLLQLLKDVVKASLFEDQTLLRLKMMWRGFADFCLGRYGPYSAHHGISEL